MTNNISRIFVLRNAEEAAGFPGRYSNRSTVVLTVEGDKIALEKKSGRNPLTVELCMFLNELLLAYEEEFGEPLTRPERTNRYRFVERIGSSGCVTRYIEEDKGDGFPSRHFIFHESGAGKVPDFTCNIYDLLDLLVGEGAFAIKSGAYKPRINGEDCHNGNLGDLMVLKPRLLAYEEGWTSPWEDPPVAVPLMVVREQPFTE